MITSARLSEEELRIIVYCTFQVLRIFLVIGSVAYVAGSSTVEIGQVLTALGGAAALFDFIWAALEHKRNR